MSDGAQRSLLPNGLRDVLAPEAAHEARALETLLGHFQRYGYDRIEPPLVEFEENLLDGVGASMGPHTFRLMDPVSQRMMGVRADITPQIARIAGTRLYKQPRPLRLAYGGAVLRVSGTQLRPERAFKQAGCELIGPDSPAADAEAIEIAAGAVKALGVQSVSVDICLPTLVPALCDTLDIDRAAALKALDAKDAAAVDALGGEGARVLSALLRASGPADDAIAALEKLADVAPIAAATDRFKAVLGCLRDAAVALTVTIDPVERKGFEYQQGLSFTVFARGVRGELGRGGRYRMAGAGDGATGFTLYLDSLLRAMPAPQAEPKVFIPWGTPPAEAQALRNRGWNTVSALEPVSDQTREALRLRCTHQLESGEIVALAEA